MRLVIEGFKKCEWCKKFQLKPTKRDGNTTLYDCENCGARYIEDGKN